MSDRYPSDWEDPDPAREPNVKRDDLLAAGRSFWQSDKDSDPGLRIIRDGVVKVRRAVLCCGEPMNGPTAHSCQVGQLAYKEVSIFDGRWVSAYVCAVCLMRQD